MENNGVFSLFQGKYVTKVAFGGVLVVLTFITLALTPGSEQSISGATTSAQPNAPKILSTFNLPGTTGPNDITLKNDLAFVVGNSNNYATAEFSILNISQSSAPQLVGSLDLKTSGNEVAITDNYAYVATDNDSKELMVVDVTNPAIPVIVSSYNTPTSKNGLAVATQGTKIYLGTAQNLTGPELYVFQQGSGGVVTLLGSYEVGDSVNDIEIVNTTAYLASNNNSKELVAVDISNPTAISEIASYNTPGSGDANGVTYDNGSLYLVTNNEYSADDFFVLKAPSLTFVGSVDLQSSNNDVRIFRDRAYVVTSATGQQLTVVDLSNPSTPREFGSFTTGGESFAIKNVSSTLYYVSGANSKEVQIAEAFFRPNIIVILSDDQRADTIQYMPLLQQQLGVQGMTFSNGFVPTSVCCPSRVNLLTGQYSHHTGVLTNSTAFQGGAPQFIGKDASTMATWLKDSGYRTGFFGKYLNGYTCTNPGSCYIPPGWSTWEPNLGGYYNYNLLKNGQFIYHGSSTSDYSTDVLKDEVLQFIWSSTSSQPYFALLALNAPHSSGFGLPEPAPRHKGSFSNLTPWRPPSYNENGPDVLDKPTWVQELPLASDSLGMVTYGLWNDFFRIAQVESLQAVDEAVAAITTAVQNSGKNNDTLIVYLTDNGLGWGEHRIFFTKICSYEECIRTPFLLRYPRFVSGGATESRMVMNIDIGPTLAELAGVIPSIVPDGTSLLPILRNQATSWRNDFLVEHWHEGADSEGGFDLVAPTHAGVRNQNWKYVEYPGSNEAELYDLANDPYELNNLASSTAHQGVLNSMKIRLHELRPDL